MRSNRSPALHIDFSENSNCTENSQMHISSLKSSYYFHKSFQPLRSLTFAIFGNLGLQEISRLLIKAAGSSVPAFTDLSHSWIGKVKDNSAWNHLCAAANVPSHKPYTVHTRPRSAHLEREAKQLQNSLVVKGTGWFGEWEPPKRFKSIQNNPAAMTTKISSPSGRTGGMLKCLVLSLSLTSNSSVLFFYWETQSALFSFVCVVDLTFCAV